MVAARIITRYCLLCKKVQHRSNVICRECRKTLPKRDLRDSFKPACRFGEEPSVPGLEERILNLQAAATVAMERISQGMTPEPLMPYPRDESID